MGKKAVEKPFLERVDADPSAGLTGSQAEERIAKGYRNIAADPNDKSTLKILAENLFSFFNIVLFSIALLFIGFIIYLNAIGRTDIVNQYFGFSKFVFLIPAVMNVGMGTYQQISSLKVIKKLKIVTSTKTKVIRDGQVNVIDARDVVIDDIIALSAGDQATADLTVLEGEVEVDESMLTGESDHVKKKAGDTILSGSSIIVGSAKTRAVKVGEDTYAAELTRKVKSGASHKSELMTSIMKIIKLLTIGLLIAITTVTVTLVVKIIATGGDPAIWGMQLSLNDPVTWALIVLTDGTFGIGMIPTGLVLTTSVTMMVSIASLTKKKTLVQELYSLENLSRVDIICLDKTGTLTDGTMSVSHIKSFIGIGEVEKHARALMAAAGDRNATAEAVYQKFGIDENADIKEIIPFSSATKYSGLIYNDGRKLLMGAPEYLLDKDDPNLGYVEKMASEGNRVIAMTLDGELIAFIAIEDHIRESAPDTLKFFRENNVTVKVISGDNPLTVSKIAQKCGIENADKYISLAGVPLEEIPAIAEEYTVFARVSPEQKEALVLALQAKKHKVAMTGDGVNDILALRKADSSITFAKATDAAKSCSDVVLLDNDFSHLKDVVGEGRRVIGNIRKTSVLYLMKSIAVFIFSLALIPFDKGQMWFQVENMYLIESAVIGTGGFLLSLEPRRTPIRGAFLKYTLSQSLCAGTLAASAILLPILLYTIPAAAGAVPFVHYDDVRPMMTVMMTMAGVVVVFAMCIPFNKYRSAALTAVIFVASFLGALVPSAYIGGHTIGADMFKVGEGQTIFDSQFVRELFRPDRSAAVQGLVSRPNNFIVLRIFIYVAIPIFILLMFAIENFARKEIKDVKIGRAFRIGRRFMLASGLVLIIHGILAAIEAAASTGYFVQVNTVYVGNKTVILIVNFAVIALHLAIGYIGYKLWKDPTKKMIKVAFGSAVVLTAVTVVMFILSGNIIRTGSVLLMLDGLVILINTVFYITGAVIVVANYSHGLLKPRGK
ncbi:MAG: HAD-IC family P-type ATPase [Clostridia bacterium]|nr:HAD-IC family P-type ATPase [Clostridia bacterium]